MRIIYRDVVGAFIFSADNKILLGKSSRGTYEGTWIVPGDGVEDGESKLDALKRELLEELGLDISDGEVEEIDIDLSGESPKVLKDSGEEVLGKYKFYNFVVRYDKNATEIPLEVLDDFVEPTWYSVSELINIKLAPPSIISLKHLGLL
jgi:8-oxo-dGTP pyrophosphatase MutT (NUDIX family)